MEHSIIFPLPFNIHIGFVIVSVILLILCYIKRKYLYELYMLIGVVSTLFVYVTVSNKITFYILGLEEIILLILTIIDMAKVSKKNAEAEKAAAAEGPLTENAKMPEISAESSNNEDE